MVADARAGELELLRSTARDFVAREIVPHVDRWEADGDFPVELFRRAGAVGLYGAKFAPEWGGFGPDFEAEAAITEELGRCGSAGVANALGAHKDLACHYLDSFGSTAQKERLLQAAITGALVGGLAITEPGGGSDVAALRTTAARTTSGWRLTGQKVFITNGDIANFLVVAARVAPGSNPREISLFVVEPPLHGFEARRMQMLGWRTSHTCELFFDGCELPTEALLGNEGEGFAYLMRALTWERIVMAIGAVAASSRALEEGIQYARDRKTFGKALIEQPVWRHRFAQCWAEVEAARALAREALHAYANGTADRDTGAIAKLVATQTACRIADEVVQIHGGYGYSMEYPAQRYWRDARLGPIGGGTSEVLREVIARSRL